MADYLQCEVYVPVDDLLDCVAPAPGAGGRMTPSGCFGNGALDIHDGTVCDIDQYELWETTSSGTACNHCAAPDFLQCVGAFVYRNEDSSIENEDSCLEKLMVLGRAGGDYSCSPHCCTCFSAPSHTLFLNPTVGDQWVTLTGAFSMEES